MLYAWFIYIYMYIRMYLYLLSLTFLRALTGWGRHPMHSDWIGRSQTTTVRSPTCRCTWIEVFRQRQIFGVLMFGRSCILYPIIFYTHIYCIHIERERGEKEINFIQLDLFPQGLVIALILWCIYCATSAEIQVPEGTPAVVFTLQSTSPTWHQNHLWHRLREYDTWTCAGRQCWRWPKLVLALSLLLDRWAFVIFFSLYNIRILFFCCHTLKSLNTYDMFSELPVFQHVSTNFA